MVGEIVALVVALALFYTLVVLFVKPTWWLPWKWRARKVD